MAWLAVVEVTMSKVLEVLGRVVIGCEVVVVLWVVVVVCLAVVVVTLSVVVGVLWVVVVVCCIVVVVLCVMVSLPLESLEETGAETRINKDITAIENSTTDLISSTWFSVILYY